MLTYTDKIRNIATRLLKSGEVDAVVGFRKGTMPMINEPCIITKLNEVSSLVWNSNCRANLANYLTNRKDKLAVIAKGCDSRNIVVHITENKINREQLYIIGAPCTGMIDRRKINKLINDKINSVYETDTTIIVETPAPEKIILTKNEVLQSNCALCLHPNPVISDEMLSDLVEEQKGTNRYAEIEKIEKKGHQERCSYFYDLFAPCIRCYACKNACPLCYCPVCFVDESKPQWVGKGQDPNDLLIFHFLRAYHCAGRCTDCGACEQACPVEINMRLLTRKLEKSCTTQFDWEAGLSLEHRPALDVYQEDDPNEFIR